MNLQRRQLCKYLTADLLASAAGWLAFNVYRYHMLGYAHFPSLKAYLTWRDIVVGQVLGPLLWVALFALSGYYSHCLLKSRVEELKTTLSTVLVGTVVFFFAIVLNDLPTSPDYYFHLLGVMWCTEFGAVYLMRVLITSYASRRVHDGRWGYNTLVIGTGSNARRLLAEMAGKRQKLGYLVRGCVATAPDRKPAKGLDVVGELENLDRLVRDYRIEHFIFAPDTQSEAELYAVIARLYRYGLPVRIYASKHDIIAGRVRMQSLYDAPMIDVSRGSLTPLQANLKRLTDIGASLLALTLLSPLYALLALVVRLDSPGPVIFRQERIGRWGRPFSILKFRSMRVDAEQGGPLLSHEGDSRITRTGRFMRKYRLDELPQFLNILRGEMSLVGPRPERAVFIEQIERQAPYYCLVHQVLPGLTSWGMVKYGYASTVEEMVERLQYDLIYLENMSPAVDCKILIYTVRTVLTGQGI